MDLRGTGPPPYHKSVKGCELSSLRRGLQDETRSSRTGSATEQLCDLWKGTQALGVHFLSYTMGGYANIYILEWK